MANRNHEFEREPLARLAGKHYWPSDEFSVPADNFCWNSDAEPDRDYKCIKQINHAGRCDFYYSPMLRDYSWKDKK